MTLSDLWRSFRWPTYCSYFCAQLTRDLLAIAKFLVNVHIVSAAMLQRFVPVISYETSAENCLQARLRCTKCNSLRSVPIVTLLYKNVDICKGLCWQYVDDTDHRRSRGLRRPVTAVCACKLISLISNVQFSFHSTTANTSLCLHVAAFRLSTHSLQLSRH